MRDVIVTLDGRGQLTDQSIPACGEENRREHHPLAGARVTDDMFGAMNDLFAGAGILTDLTAAFDAVVSVPTVTRDPTVTF